MTASGFRQLVISICIFWKTRIFFFFLASNYNSELHTINRCWCKATKSSRPLPPSKGPETSERRIIRPTLSSWACWFCKFCPFEQGTRGQTQLTHQAGQPPLCGKSPQAARSGSSSSKKKNPCRSLRHQEAAPLRWSQRGCSSSFFFCFFAQLLWKKNLTPEKWLKKVKKKSQLVRVVFLFLIQILITISITFNLQCTISDICLSDCSTSFWSYSPSLHGLCVCVRARAFPTANYTCIQIVGVPGGESSVSTSEKMQIMSSWLKSSLKNFLILPLFAQCCLCAVLKRESVWSLCGRWSRNYSP